MTAEDTEEETCGGCKETCGGRMEGGGDTEEETCGGREEAGRMQGGEEGDMKLPRSVTALSTIAVQAGQSLIVVSVLKSGSVVHLQLVQVCPGLCEIGSNQEENQTLIQEQQKLIYKLQKHEAEVVSVVEKKGRKRRHAGMKEEEEEEVSRAMVASLTEGWRLLLRLLHRRQEVLTLAAEFYRRAMEFAVSIDRLEDQSDRLSYDILRKDVLGKSLQVLSSCSVLLQKLGALQRTEALQRTGGVLQEGEESSPGPPSSSGTALRVEQLVEALQDRRRRMELDRPQNGIMVRRTSRDREGWNFTASKNQNQDLQSESTSDRRAETRTKETRTMQSGSDVKPECRSEPNRSLQSRSRLNPKSESKSEETRDLESGYSVDQTLESRPEETKYLEPGFESRTRLDVKPGAQQEATENLHPGSRVDQTLGSRPDDTKNLHPGTRVDQMLRSRSDDTKNLQTGSRVDQILESRPEETKDLQSGFRPTNTHTNFESGSRFKLKTRSMPEETKNLQPGSRVDRKLECRPDNTKNLQTGFKSTLKTESRTIKPRDIQPGSDLKLECRPEETKDLEPERRSEKTRILQSGCSVDPSLESRSKLEPGFKLSVRPECRSQEKKDLEPGSRSEQTRNLQSGLDLKVRDIESESESGGNQNLQPGSGSDGQLESRPVESEDLLTNQRLLLVEKASGAELNRQPTVDQLGRTGQEVTELRRQRENYRKYKQRLNKTLQDLNGVSEMLDSCTRLDLGSDLQTSRLVQRFIQAAPHFTKLDAEVESLRRIQDSLGVLDWLEEEGPAETRGDLSEVLDLQQRVKTKISQSETILDLSRSFHLTASQLEALLQSEAAGSRDQQQIQNLLQTASTLKTEICTAVTISGGTCFSVEQLEVRLLSLDSRCVSRRDAARRHEEKLRLTRLLSDDISQLRDSFKELKKRFNNLRFNFLKRNDRRGNMKAIRNHLQQVELNEEKLQALRKRVQGVAARLGSEVRDGGVAREAEDAVNQLQRQMGEFERSVGEHQKTLEMTCRLQLAMEEYQLWCEDASATIARVGRFSSECRSTDAVSVLQRQFETFVWPTVPQQEERIGQIRELAARLHGAEEGRRYVEKTVSKHSAMVESIRELSNDLMELQVKLKLESLKPQHDDREKETKKEKETEEKERDEAKEKLKENRKMKKEQTDNRCTLEAADMNELKETGHTPELTAEHDGKKVPVKRQTAANRKPPLQKSHSQDTDRHTESRQEQHSQTFTSSYGPPHSLSHSCSPVEANRRIHAIHSPLQLQATPPPSVIGPSFSDIQRAFQRKDASAGVLFEAELQQHEVITEDSFSSDEYDCASPDDISLPPLAETPESYLVHSDVEESSCFHSNQYPHQSEHGGSGAVRQHRESSLTEGSPTPPTNYSSTRFRSESSSFVQSPLTVRPPGLLTSTLSSILIIGKTSTANISQRTDLSRGGTEPDVPSESNQVHKTNTPDNRPLSPTDPLLKQHKSQNNHHQGSPGTLGKNTKNVASKGETMPQMDPIPMVAELNPRTTHSQSNDSDHDLHNDNIPLQDPRFLKCSPIFPLNRTSICQNNSSPQSSSDSEKNLHWETSLVSQPPRGGLTRLSSPQSETSSKIDLVQQAGGFAQSPSLKDRIEETGLLKSCATYLQTATTLPQDGNLSQSNQGSRRGLDPDVPSFQTSKETSSIFMNQSSSLTSAVKPSLTQSSSSLSSPQESLFSQSEMSQLDQLAQAKGCPQSPGLKNKTGVTGGLKSRSTCLQTDTTLPQYEYLSQSNQGLRRGLDQDVLSFQTSKVTSASSIPQSSSLTTDTTVKQTCQSSPPDTQQTLPQASNSPQGSGSFQSESFLKINLVTQERGFAQSPSLRDRIEDTGLLKSCATCLQSTTSLPQEGNISQNYPASMRGLGQDVPFSKTSKETSSVSINQSRNLTTTVKPTESCQSSSPDAHHTLPQASNSPQESWLFQSESLPKINLVAQDRGFAQSPSLRDSYRDTCPLPPKDMSNISISSGTITSSNRVSSKQNHQTVYSLQKSLISTCTQQCVHDGMVPDSPAKPTSPPPPPHPKPQTQASAQQANPHVTPFSSTHHLLTPYQDPNICQPMAVCEEIRLTPQIQGPPLPAPPPAPLPQVQAESLPQGKASKSGPPCFTRPLSRASVIEGSPVTLEVEVTGQPEPTLTWCKDGGVSAPGPGRARPPCEDGLVPEASGSDGGRYESRVAAQRGSSADDWLLGEVFDIIGVDWLTWFGTLCVLLWLIYLILLW
ncbi:uncharacterized protein ccdc141 [Etheostoma spectabile]|uniref:uncharacterized protein ccdc141 n=1 Tax=Etheostoma spectabile TaxID=54343 RepID=UPI0013AECAE0|nr:coiled-coil domain-containing protein 141 [Etheostoma spectabile]